MALSKKVHEALKALELPKRFGGSYERAAQAILDEDPEAVCGTAKHEATRKFHDAGLRALQSRHVKAWGALCQFQRSKG